jgi:nucleoside permease NupC
LSFSANRRDLRWRIVIAALSTRIGIGALILFMPFGKAILADMAAGVNRILITAVPVRVSVRLPDAFYYDHS